VAATHRRQGILRQMMRRQLDDVHDSGETIAGLTASESLIYGRFGYGQASAMQTVRVVTRASSFSRPVDDAGRFTILDRAEAAKVLPDLHERIRAGQNGDNSRDRAWWNVFLSDPRVMRHDRSALFLLLHETPAGEPDGYASWRIKDLDSEDGNELFVEDLRALSPDTEAALWRFVFDIDLVGEVVAGHRPLDDPLRWRLLDPRRVVVTEQRDMLWLRLVDVVAGLGSRSYATDDDLAVELADEFCPWNTGTWLLAGGSCSETSRPGDLRLTARDLGAAYLGGVRFSTLARAGRVEELKAGALTRADAMFATERLPWTTRDF
jgi:predicted acetyltransferase